MPSFPGLGTEDMQKLETDVLVVGGGSTGTGVVRDLAMRGFKSMLVEKSDLSTGTTGRYHGLLHSGGRYAVKDPHAARECIEENRILRQIMPHCLEDTGGFFVVTPWDDPDYAPRFVEGCRNAGIPVEEIPIAQMLREEPLLNPRISQCFRVPDASADSFLAADNNARSAAEHGALIHRYSIVTGLIRKADRVVGARIHDLVKDQDFEIYADLIVNAAGAWAGKIAATASVVVKIVPGKGTMIAMNHRIVNTVINRCKMPADGDILVPAYTVAVIGTTDVPVVDPDQYGIEPWEVRLMLEEGEKMVPGFMEMRMLRAWAGLRPLYQETAAASNRDLTRAFVLLDHAERDGVDGLVTITSGKWTTYRKMAEATVDLVCRKLGVARECRTHLEALPGAEHGLHYLGLRLAEVEKKGAYGSLVCECELATYEDVRQAIEAGAETIDDIRRDVRLGMGPCQGGFCTLRAAGMLHDLLNPAIEKTNVALRDFLQERWKGLLPILWGQQLRQERLDELIYLSVLNADHLPGPRASRLAAEMYEVALSDARPANQESTSSRTFDSQGQASTSVHGEQDRKAPGGTVDVLVIGAGLAGLTAAWQAASRGKRTRLISKGMGATHWGAGCIDVLGYYPGETEEAVRSPIEGLERLVKENRSHPYALSGLDNLAEALLAIKEYFESAGYPLQGSLDSNWMLPTALGVPRPTCLAPETMTAGDLNDQTPILLVGIAGYADFYPYMAAENLKKLGLQAQAVLLDIPIIRERRFTTARTLAFAFDQPEFREVVASAVKPFLNRGSIRAGFPAVLGWSQGHAAWKDMQNRLDCPVFEIPCLPPSIPGIRMHNLLSSAVHSAGGRVYDGMQAHQADANQRVEAVFTEAAARSKAHRAGTFVLATGGIMGGGIFARHTGDLIEKVFGLTVSAPREHSDWFSKEFLSIQGHPVYRAGVSTGKDLRPIGESGQPIYPNLYAAGSILAGFDPIQERSIEGIALATGYLAGKLAAGVS
jgi:glycerol-3-phosphate dehydrogenase